jgi:phage-related protein
MRYFLLTEYRNFAIKRYLILERRMPETEVLLFAEEDGSCPLLDWLDLLPSKVQDKCIVRVERLSKCGHELRRPEADLLRDGIYELRVAFRRVQHRMLYFFMGGQAIITHGCSKEGKVPPGEIDLAVDRRSRFAKNPLKYTWREKE